MWLCSAAASHRLATVRTLALSKSRIVTLIRAALSRRHRIRQTFVNTSRQPTGNKTPSERRESLEILFTSGPHFLDGQARQACKSRILSPVCGQSASAALRSNPDSWCEVFPLLFRPWRPAPKDSSQLRLPKAGLGRARVDLSAGRQWCDSYCRPASAAPRPCAGRPHKNKWSIHRSHGGWRRDHFGLGQVSHSFAAGLVLKASTGSDWLSGFHVNQISEAGHRRRSEGWYIGREGIDAGRYCEKRRSSPRSLHQRENDQPKVRQRDQRGWRARKPWRFK